MHKKAFSIKRCRIGILLFAVVLMSCPLMPEIGHGVVATTKSITLEWNPPSVVYAAAPLAVTQYSVYIRKHNSGSWHLVGVVPATENPSITLDHSDFGNGWFDFAVSALNGLGWSSRLHSCLDENAQPFGGWFLEWFYNE